MYGNHIIKDLKLYVKKSFPRLTEGLATEKYKQQIYQLVGDIRNSPQFYLGNFKNITNQLYKIFPDKKIKPFNDPISSRFNSPYPNFMLCYDSDLYIDNLNEKEIKMIKNYPHKYWRNAIMVKQVGETIYELQEINHDVVSCKWRVSPIKIYFTSKESISQTDFYQKNKHKFSWYDESFDQKNNIAHNLMFDSSVNDNLTVKFINARGYTSILQKIGGITHLFLFLTNCPNIVTENITKGIVSKKKKKTISLCLDIKFLGSKCHHLERNTSMIKLIERIKR